jgi:glutathione S-transferase
MYPASQGWPAAPAARAHARAVSCEMHSGLGGVRQHLPFNAGRDAPRATWPPAADADVARLKEILGGCRRRFGQQPGAGGPYLFGAFSIADACLAPAALRLAQYHVPLADAPEAAE